MGALRMSEMAEGLEQSKLAGLLVLFQLIAFNYDTMSLRNNTWQPLAAVAARAQRELDRRSAERRRTKRKRLTAASLMADVSATGRRGERAGGCSNCSCSSWLLVKLTRNHCERGDCMRRLRRGLVNLVD